MDNLRKAIRDIPDFPKPGILFKDISPLFKTADLINETRNQLTGQIKFNFDPNIIDMVVGLESRGFLHGTNIASYCNAGFALARKPGKLPYEKISHSYDLEYGSSTIEMHTDSIEPGQNVLIHDDLLATGGTALAAAELVKKLGGNVIGFSFIVELEFLGGANKIEEVLGKEVKIMSLLKY